MISKNNRIKLFLTVCTGFLSMGALAQLNANGGYLMGNFIELGIHNNGHEGTFDIAGSNSRTTSFVPEVFFGFVANPQMDNWINYDGDFFTPGSPENGFGMEINGVNYSNNGVDATWVNTTQNEIPVFSIK